MPLVYVGADSEAAVSDAQARARKIDPRLARGELVRVAGGRNQSEAEMIQNLLLEEGVPSVMRRSAGFDVPDFLAAGPRDVLVPEAGAQTARELLMTSELAPAPAATGAELSRSHSLRLLAGVIGGGLLAALVAWAAIHLTG